MTVPYCALLARLLPTDYRRAQALTSVYVIVLLCAAVSSSSSSSSQSLSVVPDQQQQQQQPQSYNAYLYSMGGRSTSFFDQPILMSSYQLTDSCQRHMTKTRRRQQRSLLSYDAFKRGSYRLGQLYCQTGFHLEIHDNGVINGTKSEYSPYAVLEFFSVAFGLVSIRGKQSERFLCMTKRGRLVGRPLRPGEHISHECIFMERMLENYYNTYSSCAYPPARRLPTGKLRKRRWYISLSNKGKPRRGKRTRQKKKITHFLVLHLDESDVERAIRVQQSVSDLLGINATSYDRLLTTGDIPQLNRRIAETRRNRQQYDIEHFAGDSHIDVEDETRWREIFVAAAADVSPQQQQQPQQRTHRHRKHRQRLRAFNY